MTLLVNHFLQDYALFVPEEFFSQLIAEAEPVSLSKDFVEQCGQDNFHISPSAPDFCQSSAFSVTTNFLNTTLPCECDLQGSLQHSCAEFGGQCACKSNVIGRKCNKCRTGYYGFPNCRSKYSMVLYRSDIHSHSTRSCNNLNVEKTNLEITKKSFRLREQLSITQIIFIYLVVDVFSF